MKEHDADIYLFDYYQEFAERQNVRHLMEKSGELSETWIHSLRMAPFNFLMVDGKPYEAPAGIPENVDVGGPEGQALVDIPVAMGGKRVVLCSGGKNWRRRNL